MIQIEFIRIIYGINLSSNRHFGEGYYLGIVNKESFIYPALYHNQLMA